MGKALYRKYRPTRLDDVIGQDAVTAPLATAIKQGKISHAYLFTGPRGCGKTSVARIFAHEINHLKYELEDSYTDIQEIDAASNTGVDNIRELREKAIIAPTAAKYKVYIIDEVHMLSKSAFNALLKILEEPPTHVVFIMATTDPEKVPVTITSRAQTYIFKLANPEIIKKHLAFIAQQEKIPIDDTALEIIALRGGGSFRDSISLLDQLSNLSDTKITAPLVTAALGLPQDELISQLLTAYRNNDLAEITAKLKDALNSGIKPEYLAEELIRQITTQPDPTLLPLLAKLPEVRAPFAEARLLVALLGQIPTPSQPTPPAQPTATPQPAPTAPIQSSPTPSAPSAPTPPPTPDPMPPAPTNFSWEVFITTVESDNINLFHYLERAGHELQGGDLHIYPANQVEKRIMASAKNHQLLTKISGIKVVIHDPATKSAAKSPALTQISDIMGAVEEVNDGRIVPF